MKADRAEAIHNMLRARGRNVDRADVALAAMNVDEEAHLKKAEKAVRWEVWDKKTPINGVPAAQILSRPDYQGGEIYLIYINDRLVFLQPHAPSGEGIVGMSKSDVKQMAKEHAEQLVDSVFMESVTEEVATKVTDLPPPAPTPGVRFNGAASDAFDVDEVRVPGPRRSARLAGAYPPPPSTYLER